MAWWMPVLQAIGINAAKNVVTGQDPFKNALQAGVTGGVLGATAGSTNVSGVGSAPSGVSGVGSAPSAASSSLGTNSGLLGSNTIESVMGPANAAGTYTNSDYFSNILGNQVYTGNDGLLSQIGTGAGSIFDMAKNELGGSMTPQNLIGVANLLSQDNQQPQNFAPAGGVKQGSYKMGDSIPTAISVRKKRRGNV